MLDKIIGEGITFDDVLLVPQRSDVVPSEVSTETRFSRRVGLNLPISSAAMDTVTEANLAIALAQEGGIGIIHKNLSIEAQVREVDKVKRSANGVILDPVTMPPHETVQHARELMEKQNISGVPITESGRLVGILTRRDLRFIGDPAKRVADVMTRKNLVTAPLGTTLEDAKAILHRNKVEKLLLTDGKDALRGLITIKDLDKLARFPKASRDGRGRLRVGAAVGVRDDERASALIRAGVDVLVVDTAHGHSRNVLDAVRRIKGQHDIDVVAGNVATTAAVRDLAEAGADAVKIGIGPGAICTTRIIAGVGVPQLTAILECAPAARERGLPCIADGGIRNSGDLAKAIAAGADAVMVGSLFAGMAESPAETVLYQGRSYKVCRGMGSLGAMIEGSKERYGQSEVADRDKLVPEGVEGLVPFRGPLSEFVYQLAGGLRASMGYNGAATIAQFQERARFLRVSPATQRENHPHDIIITKEAPNYWADR